MDMYDMQIDFDPVRLVSIGFTQQEVQCLASIINMGYKVNSNTLSYMGIDYETQQRIKYMYSICCGRVNLDTDEEIIRHLKKLNNHAVKIGISTLPISNIYEVPRIAVVAGLNKKPFDIWNSTNYSGKAMIYKVSDVKGKTITIETTRKPQLKYKETLSIPDVLTIKGVKADGKTAVIAFDKKYCRLCNRFIIIATLRRPEFHHGMYKIICFEGTRVYVYARTMGVKDGVKYNGNTERVYAFGFFPDEIEPKLRAVAKNVYDFLHGVKVDYETANSDYRLLDTVRQDADIDDEMSQEF